MGERGVIKRNREVREHDVIEFTLRGGRRTAEAMLLTDDGLASSTSSTDLGVADLGTPLSLLLVTRSGTAPRGPSVARRTSL
jgi:hypothetical protein